MEKFDFNQAAFKAHAALKHEGFTLKRSHVGEILAAALGYREYAALALENADTTQTLHLADAEHVVLSEPRAVVRVGEMALAADETGAKRIAEVIIQTTVAEWPNLYSSIEAFVDEHLHEYLSDAMTFAQETSDAEAESNAEFPYGVEVDEVDPESDDLWSARNAWSASANGTMSGNYHPDGDRVFNGDKVHCSATVFYLKAGRAGLVFDTLDTRAAAGGWGDAEFDRPTTEDA